MKSGNLSRALGAGVALALLAQPMAAAAQDGSAASAVTGAAGPAYLADSVSPFGTVKIAEGDMGSIAMPKTAFSPSPTDVQDYDKYYVFHRPGTDFATAYADISECDGYARGLQSGITYQQAPYPYTYTMAGAVGSAIGNALAAAIFGSAEKRRLRRVNMRQCMHFKGYERYGMAKGVWKDFNFEEGLTGVSETDRQRYLKQQAMVASASEKPQGEGLGL